MTTTVATWERFEAEAPALAAAVRARFEAHKHKTMATVRADGAPRISGTEVEIRPDGLWLGGMTGARRFADLRRDPRVAIHSASQPPDVWDGDAKVGGVAVEVTDPAARAAYVGGLDDEPPGDFELFRVDLTEATVLSMTPERDAILVETWRPGRPVTSVRRA